MESKYFPLMTSSQSISQVAVVGASSRAATSCLKLQSVRRRSGATNPWIVIFKHHFWLSIIPNSVPIVRLVCCQMLDHYIYRQTITCDQTFESLAVSAAFASLHLRVRQQFHCMNRNKETEDAGLLLEPGCTTPQRPFIDLDFLNHPLSPSPRTRMVSHELCLDS